MRIDVESSRFYCDPQRVSLLERVQAYTLANFRLDPLGKHGLPHWLGVRAFGLAILRDDGRVTEENVLFVELFSLLHDVARCDENRDPEHGRRAGRLVATIEELVSVTSVDLELLAMTCATHVVART